MQGNLTNHFIMYINSVDSVTPENPSNRCDVNGFLVVNCHLEQNKSLYKITWNSVGAAVLIPWVINMQEFLRYVCSTILIKIPIC